MMIPASNHHHPPRPIFNRASAGTAGSAIGAGGLAAKNAGGSDQSTKFIIGFCVAIPCTLIIVGLYLFVRRRRSKKLGSTAASSNHDGRKPRSSAWGKKTNKGGGIFGKFPSRLKPAEPPAAYKRDKELLPSAL